MSDPMDCSTPSFPVVHYLLKFMSTESVMLSNHPILCRPLLLLPSILPSIRVFSSESALCIRWPKYWSFTLSNNPSSEYSGLISFRIHWFDLFAVQGTAKLHGYRRSEELSHGCSKSTTLSSVTFSGCLVLHGVVDADGPGTTFWKHSSNTLELCDLGFIFNILQRMSLLVNFFVKGRQKQKIWRSDSYLCSFGLSHPIPSDSCLA